MIEIRKFLDLNQLQRVQDQCAIATGMAIVLLDTEGNTLSKPSNFTNVCQTYTPTNPSDLCQQDAFYRAQWMDISLPLLVGEEQVGTIFAGQVLSKTPREESVRSLAYEFGLEEDSYLRAVQNLPLQAEKSIRASADTLGMLLNQWVNLSYMNRSNANQVNVFDQEMQHIMDDIRAVNNKTKDLTRVASMEKILSLNAAVEAARAGQAGVGFAVVAREIGELSNNSAKIYGEIIDLMESIRNAISLMDNAHK